ILDEFDQHAVGTKPTSLRQATNFSCGGCWKADALAYSLVWGTHDTIMHHYGANLQVLGVSLAFRHDERMNERRVEEWSKPASFTKTVKRSAPGRPVELASITGHGILPPRYV